MIDWNRRSDDFVRFVLDPTRQGDYLPLMWWDDTRIAGRGTTFGLLTYVGMKGQWGVFRNAHESFVSLGVVLSGTLLGHDMTRYPVPGSPQPVDLVRMQSEYFSPKQGNFCNLINGDEQTGISFFYELMPNLFVAPLCARYPQEADLTDKWHRSCTAWANAGAQLWTLNDYNFQAFDLLNRRAVVKDWREPDAAAGIAYLMLMAYAKWPEEKSFYNECHHALTWMEGQSRNLNYGVSAPFGVYASARSNAEFGSSYNTGKFLSWCFETSDFRGIGPHAKSRAEGDDYGIISGRWGDTDVAGLVGAGRISYPESGKKPGGRGAYLFAMETFVHAWPLVAATRYDNRLARAVGRWMYHAAHSARLFYPDQLAPDMQTDYAWAKRYSTAIPYEAIRERNIETGKPGPYGCGDPTAQGWGPINLGLYSGAFSGVFGAIVKPTDVDGILALDTRATDVLAASALPSSLFYNPHGKAATITWSVGAKPVRIWEAVSNRWISEQPVTGTVRVPVPADNAALVVAVPADLAIHFDHGRLYAGSTVVDYSVPDGK